VLLFRGRNAVLALFRQGSLQFNPPPFKAQGRAAGGLRAVGCGKAEVPTDAKHSGKNGYKT